MFTCKESESLGLNNFNQKKNSLLSLITILFIFFSSNIFADGLIGKYYDESDFTNLKMTKIDESINLEWGNGSPDESISNNTYSVIWTGYIYFPENSNYTFHLAHDDKFILNIDGTELYNDGSWTGGADNYNTTNNYYFTSGYYPITIQFIENTGGAYAKLAWSNTNSISSRTIVPTDNLFTTLSVGCDDSLDSPDADDSTPGTIITAMNNISIDTSTCISGSSVNNDKDYYYFTVASDGLLNITTSSPNSQKYHLKVGSSSNGNEYYGDTTAQSHTVPQITLSSGDSVYLYVKETGNDTDEYQINFDFTVTNTSPPLPSDEDIPTDDSSELSVLCGTFADMFQTHGTCNGTSGGSIEFTNAGQTLDNSKNIILDNNDNSINTCQVIIPDWVENQYESCGTSGDCSASGTGAKSFNITYSNAPTTAIVDDSPSSSSEDKTLNGTSNLSAYAYNNITTNSNTNTTTTFGITNQLKINTLKLTTNNNVAFNSASAYSLDIGTLGVDNNGAGNTITTDSNAKNVKINTFSLPSNTSLTLEAAQTIKMEDFTVGRGSTVSLKAPYININNFTSSNSGNGDSTIEIYADYIDIGDLTLNQTVSLKIYPYTAGKRVLFRTNTLKESSSSSIEMSSGNYYINTKLDIPGTSDISAIRAMDGDQLINLYINNDLTLGNNPGINATGNNGNYDITYPAANFLMFINGNLTTGGGGTTINATIYLEGNAYFGNPTYIKGALNANNYISIGQGQFTYDQSISDAGWAECLPKIQFTQGQYSFDEPSIDGGIASADYYSVTVAIDTVVSYDITVTYQTYNDSPLGTFSAQSGLDYTPYIFTITIPAGDINATVKTTILRDDLIELDETFNAKLVNPLPNDGVTLGDQNTTQLIINGQDEEDIPLCFADDFSTLDTKWRLLSSTGGWTPQLIDGSTTDITDSTVLNKRLRLTNRQTNLATAVTKDYEFLAENNMIIVEFDQYAYGGCANGQSATQGGGLGTYGADGIVMVLFDSQVGDSPTPGAYGGSMGYAQGHGANGFQAGWIGLGIDEYGNFSNPTEDRNGGSGFHPNNITIRGSSDDLIDGILGNDSLNSGYKYLEEAYPINPVASKQRSPEFPGDRYRLKIDARDPTKLLVSLDRDSGSGYQSVISAFDAKDSSYNQAPAPQYVRLAFTSGSGGGCNNHDIDELSVKGVCRAYEADFPPSKGVFDAWETSGNILDRKIHTNISNKSFDLTIASINSSNNAIETKEDIIMQYRLYDNIHDQNISSWRDYNASTGAEGASSIDSFIVAAAHQKASVQFSFCGEAIGGDVIGESGYEIATLPIDSNGNVIRNFDGTVTCSGDFTEILDTFSTDQFAIRPKKFGSNLITNPTLIAGKTHSIEFRADAFNSTFTKDYNQTEDSSFVVDINISDLSKICDDMNISFSPNVNFIDGNATADFNLSNIGEFNLTIQEKYDAEFAHIDHDDGTPDSERYIEPYTKQITIVPDHFDINATYKNGSNDFTYLSNFRVNQTDSDIQISSLLELNITAVNENNETLSNYTDTCYAKDGTIKINLLNALNPVPTNSLNNFIWNKDVNGFNETNGSINLGGTTYIVDMNSSDYNATISGVQGKSILNFRINFDRNNTKVVNPFELTVKDINVTDADNVSGTKSLDQNTTFYYGRVHAPDQTFQGNEGYAKIYYEVYCDGCVKADFNITGNESVDSINWFTNTLHENNDGNVSKYESTGYVTFKGDGSETSDEVNIASGKEQIQLNVTKAPYKDRIKMTPSSWLLYDNYDATAVTSDFEVEFIPLGGAWSGSGDDMNGSVDTTMSGKTTTEYER